MEEEITREQDFFVMKVSMVVSFNFYFIELCCNHMHNKVVVVENDLLASYCEDNSPKHGVVDYQVGPFVFSKGTKWLVVIFLETEILRILTCLPFIFCAVSEKSSSCC